MGKIDLLPIGWIVKPFGLKGEFCLRPYADSPFAIQGLGRIYVQLRPRRPKPFVIESCRHHNRDFRIKLEGIDGRDATGDLCSREVLARARDLHDSGPRPFLDRGLLGVKVRLEDGELIGELVAIQDNKVHAVWTILGQQGQEILFPAVPRFVLDIDKSKRQAIICPPEGLLAIYLGP